MTTFTADLKAELLARIARHEALDTITKGMYAEAGGDGLLRVCAVGCAMVEPDDPPRSSSNWHAEMEERWGIPAWLCALEDRVFEGLALEEAVSWPRRFVESVPVGVELGQKLAHILASRRLRETVLPLAETWHEDVRDEVESAVRGMADALDHDGDLESAARSAESAARSAAWSARSAAGSAWSAAWSAWSAAWSAESAARSAWSAESSAESAAWSAESARIIETLGSWAGTKR